MDKKNSQINRMTRPAIETSVFQLSRRATDCIKIDVFIKIFYNLYIFRKIKLFLN
jgi:hypothetical protein